MFEILWETIGFKGGWIDGPNFYSIGDFGFAELLEFTITLGIDGLGNFRVLAILKDGDLGKVFFVCHNPAVIVIQAQNLNEFLEYLLGYYSNYKQHKLITIDDKILYRMCSTSVNLRPLNEKENIKFLDNAEEINRSKLIVGDLHKARNRAGFAWEQKGPNCVLGKIPNKHIWIIEQKKPRIQTVLTGPKNLTLDTINKYLEIKSKGMI